MSEPQQNLLIVDNDTRSLRVLEVSLRKAGFMVTTATTVDDALDIIHANPPDLVVSEVSFGESQAAGRDGYALLGELRAQPHLATTGFVFVTARMDVEAKLRGLELGADEFLTKPIFAKEIIARLRLILQRRSRTSLGELGDRTRFAGQLADMPVVDLLQTIEISRKSGTMQLTSGDGRKGSVYFQGGQVIDAELGTRRAEAAVYRLLTWNDGAFEIRFGEVARAAAIAGTTQALLMEGLRRLDEWNRLCEQLPPLHHALDLDVHQLKRRLGDVPDEYNELIRYLDGKRSVMAALDASGLGDLIALEQLAKLFFEGLVRDNGPAEAGGEPATTEVASEDAPSVSFEEAFDGVPSRVTEPEQLAHLRALSSANEPLARRMKPATAPLGRLAMRSARNPLDSLSPPISPATPRTITNKAAELALANAKALEEFEADTATRQVVPLSQGQVLLAQLASTPVPPQQEPRQTLKIAPRSRRTGTLPGTEGVPLAVGTAPSSGAVAVALGAQESMSGPRISRRRSALIDAAIIQAAVEPSGAIARQAGLVDDDSSVHRAASGNGAVQVVSAALVEVTDPGFGVAVNPRGDVAPRLGAPTISRLPRSAAPDATPVPVTVPEPVPVSAVEVTEEAISLDGSASGAVAAQEQRSNGLPTSPALPPPVPAVALQTSRTRSRELASSDLEDANRVYATPLSTTNQTEHSQVTELSVSRVAPRPPTEQLVLPRTRTRIRESTGTSAYTKPRRSTWPWLVAALVGALVAVVAATTQKRQSNASGGSGALVPREQRLGEVPDARAVAPSGVLAGENGGPTNSVAGQATPQPGAQVTEQVAARVVEQPAEPLAAQQPASAVGEVAKPADPDAHLDAGDAKATEPYRVYLSEARDRLAQSDLPRARLAIEKSLSEKRTARSLLVKADILRRQGENDKALATIDEALAMSREYANAWDVRGRLLWSMGRKAEARAAWNEYLRQRPTGDAADRIREILSQRE